MLKDVVWRRNSLFTDPLNFGDPLDIEASEHHLGDKEVFWNKGEDYISITPEDMGRGTAGPWTVP